VGLADLTASSVSAALQEFDEIGRDAFEARYGYGPARADFVWHNGQAYDSKAICGAAHGVGYEPLSPTEFVNLSGGVEGHRAEQCPGRVRYQGCLVSP
jgi:5-methylcytosine-specific restriction enzyme A